MMVELYGCVRQGPPHVLTPICALWSQDIMENSNPNASTIRSIFERWAVDGVGVVIGILFAFFVIIIAVVATASSKSPWDTVIATLAMVSQAFFAFVVLRMSENQNAFTKKMSERQHQIDMYPLRKDAVRNLGKAAKVLWRGMNLSDDEVEAFRLCHLEIKNLFSERADNLAFELYELMERAHLLHMRAAVTFDDGGSIIKPADADKLAAANNCFDNAFDVFTDLQNAIDKEMGIN